MFFATDYADVSVVRTRQTLRTRIEFDVGEFFFEVADALKDRSHFGSVPIGGHVGGSSLSSQ